MPEDALAEKHAALVSLLKQFAETFHPARCREHTWIPCNKDSTRRQTKFGSEGVTDRDAY